MYRETMLEHGCVLWRSSQSLAATIPADGCVDVIMHGGELMLAGPSTRAITTAADLNDALTVGVRFAPGVASSALSINMADVRDHHVPLSDVLGPAGTTAIRRTLFSARALRTPETSLATQFAGVPFTDRWVHVVHSAAVQQLDAHVVAERIGWSERHFRRRVLHTFGYSYGALVRIERAAQARRAVLRGVQLTDAALTAGYSDQSHMTREFSRIVGFTPGQLAVSAV